MRIAVIASVILLTMGSMCLIQGQTTQKLSANKINEYGLIYNLPSTVFDITLEAEGVTERPGEFYQYARIYLNADPIMAPSQSWKLKSVVITPEGVADPARQYLVQFKAGSTPYILIDDQQVPLAINDDRVPPVGKPKLPVAVPAAPTVLESPAAAYAITEEMIACTSLAKRAELAAAKIYELRETRNEIISGQSDNMPADGAAMQLVLDNLAQQEAVLTAMFLGTRQTATQVATYRYVPSDEDSRQVLARLSALKGFVAPNDLSGDPIYVNLNVTERGALPVNEKGEEKKFPKGGVAYRIPGKARLSVSYDGRTYADDVFPVAQYGVTFGVDPALFSDKKAPAYLYFDPVTGAIKELGTLGKMSE